jgi:hypothetical protein
MLAEDRSLPVTARLRSLFFITFGGPQAHGHSVEEHVERITGYFRSLPVTARLRVEILHQHWWAAGPWALR